NFIEDIDPLIQPIIGDTINRLAFMEDNGRVSIMNIELGILEDGIWYSNDYHLKDEGWCRTGCKPKKVKKKEAPKMEPLRQHKVFVYGTLKRGYGNYEHYLKDAVFLGKASTKERWTMTGETLPFPYVLEQNNTIGNNVVGEVFAVTKKELSALDRLEGIPHHYKKVETKIIYEDDSSEETVTMYIKAQFNGMYPSSMDIISEWSA
ncbi:gamma-glutamylcyclotransferase family protein, partial [Desulfobacterales bacterium HSG17]|nr:gamma-glutamylcyclotransferase family protein [Desulfobacterales bacterium HSG17]